MPKANPSRRSYYGLESASSISEEKKGKEKERDTIKLPSLAVEVIEEVKRQWDFALESEVDFLYYLSLSLILFHTPCLC
jgi:hypothetical protein